MRDFDDFILDVKEFFSKLKTKLKETFTVDNIYNHKWIIILIILVGIPTIMYFSIGYSKAKELANQQGPHLTEYKDVQDEDVFTYNIYEPIPRDINTYFTYYLDINYNISYQKSSNKIYLQPDSAYWLYIDKVYIEMYCKRSEDIGWGNVLYYNYENISANISFGEFINGTFKIPQELLNNNSMALEYDQFLIKLSMRCEHEYDSDFVTITSSYSGTIINAGGLLRKNWPAGSSYAFMVIFYYWVIIGLATTFVFLYLRKKKYSFITPY